MTSFSLEYECTMVSSISIVYLAAFRRFFLPQ